jgi:UDP-GlcNAc:undecaprenyl-phosphate GlcNAc-1-phosphate transferase
MLYLILSIVTAAALTYAFVRLAPMYGWVVEPRPDRWSARTVAKFGGVPILITALAGSLVVPLDRRMGAVMLATAVVGLVGFLDDILSLRPLHKLLAQGAISAVVAGLGVVYPLTHQPALNLVFTVAWLVGITNAFNIIDNMDGLSCGVAAIALVRIGLLAGWDSPLGHLTLIMAGALVGFLFFNFNPAKIFMGDTGSLSVGFFVAASSVLITDHLSGIFSVIAVPSLILLLPVFDVILVSTTRRMRGRAVSAGAKDHTSHRLVLLGMSDRSAVLLLYFFAASAGAMTYFSKSSWPNLGAGIVALYLSLATLFWLYLARVEMPEGWLSERNGVELAVPMFLQRIARRTAAVVFDAAMLALSLYFAFLVRLDRLDRVSAGLLMFACALSILIRIPLLSFAGGSRSDWWRIRSRADVYPVLVAGVVGGLLLSGVSYYLPESKRIMPAILFLDMVFSTGLLTLGRMAPSMFDDLMERLTPEPGLEPGMNSRGVVAFDQEWKRRGVIALGSENGARNAVLYGVRIRRLTEAVDLISTGSISSLYLLPDCPETERDQIVELCRANGVLVSQLRYSVEEIPSHPPKVLPGGKAVGQSNYSD